MPKFVFCILGSEARKGLTKRAIRALLAQSLSCCDVLAPNAVIGFTGVDLFAARGDGASIRYVYLGPCELAYR